MLEIDNISEVIAMKPRNLYRIVIGALMIASGIVSILLTAGEAIIGTMLLAAGFAFLITGIFRSPEIWR